MPRNVDVLAVWLCSGNVFWSFNASFPKSVLSYCLRSLTDNDLKLIKQSCCWLFCISWPSFNSSSSLFFQEKEKAFKCVLLMMCDIMVPKSIRSNTFDSPWERSHFFFCWNELLALLCEYHLNNYLTNKSLMVDFKEMHLYSGGTSSNWSLKEVWYNQSWIFKDTPARIFLTETALEFPLCFLKCHSTVMQYWLTLYHTSCMNSDLNFVNRVEQKCFTYGYALHTLIMNFKSWAFILIYFLWNCHILYVIMQHELWIFLICLFLSLKDAAPMLYTSASLVAVNLLCILVDFYVSIKKQETNH